MVKCGVLEEEYVVGELNGVIPNVMGSHPFVIFYPIAYVRIGSACKERLAGSADELAVSTGCCHGYPRACLILRGRRDAAAQC